MAPVLRTKKLPDTSDNKSGKIQQLSSKIKVKRKNKVSAEVKQHRLEQKRIAEKLRREKRRNDPEAYKNYCQSERARNEKRKKEGKLKSIDQLSEREKRARRKQQNLWKKNSRTRQKENIELTMEQNNMNNNVESKQAKVGRKRIQKNLRKCFRDNKKLLDDNKNLRMKINSLHKKLQRLNIKKSDSTSPEYKVDKMLNGQNVNPEVRKTLILHQVMIQQLKLSYQESRSSKFKANIGVHRSNKPLEYIKNMKSNQKFIQDRVTSFYEENSKIIPDKKASIKMNGKQVTKRYMNATIKDLHSKFCSQMKIILVSMKRKFSQYTLGLVEYNVLYTLAWSTLQKSSHGFVTLSKSLRHDPSAIIVHIKKILDVYLATNPEIKKLHIMSDGPTTQYRNKKMFYLITQYFPQCYSQLEDITYNFSEAGHGKSSADGIGGYIKKLADDQVKYGTDVSNFDSLLAILRDRVKSVYIDCVSEDEISAIDLILPNNFKPFVGTMKVHQYTWNKLQHNFILFNSLSCFDCSNKNPCIHFAMGKIDYSINDTTEKMNKRLVAKTKKSDNSTSKLTKNLKCLEKDVAKDNLEKNETMLLRRSSRIKKKL
ncbi:hypothetical protein KQX54_000175 [Cotesia glomerata]|uniref:Uncharacterized protein n=2 Tax=Cotesia glomerata TaxID=32391 RepID=A0AAV7IES2_COTGL|nr:hypothetical protein KQX54_000175 [Cotesia glomerata]